MKYITVETIKKVTLELDKDEFELMIQAVKMLKDSLAVAQYNKGNKEDFDRASYMLGFLNDAMRR